VSIIGHIKLKKWENNNFKKRIGIKGHKILIAKKYLRPSYWQTQKFDYTYKIPIMTVTALDSYAILLHSNSQNRSLINVTKFWVC